MSDPIAGEAASSTLEAGSVVREAVARLGTTPKLIVVFVGKRGSADALVPQALEAASGAPLAVIEAAGVLTSAGEFEGEGVAACALGGDLIDVSCIALPSDAPAARAQLKQSGENSTLLWLMLTPPLYSPDVLKDVPSGTVVVGGGAARAWIAADGRSSSPAAGVAVVIRSKRLRAAAVASPAVRVLTAWKPITEVSGPFIVSAGGTPLLEWFTQTPGTQAEGSPSFIVTRAKDEDSPPLLQTIAGMDPRKGAVAVKEPIAKGTEIALGIWNGDAARQDLGMRVGQLARSLGGGVPVAGFMMTCLGRGYDLFGARDVDVGALRAKFPGLPFTGMFSQFEVARFDGAPRVHVYTASIAVLYRPS